MRRYIKHQLRKRRKPLSKQGVFFLSLFCMGCGAMDANHRNFIISHTLYEETLKESPKEEKEATLPLSE